MSVDVSLNQSTKKQKRKKKNHLLWRICANVRVKTGEHWLSLVCLIYFL